VDWSLSLSFLLACFFLLISPGPGVLTTAGVGAGFGWQPGIRYVSGLCVGSNAVMTLFSGFALWPEHFAAEVAVKLVLLNLVWIPIHLLWLQAGVSLHRLALAPRTQRAINYAMAAALVAVVVMALFN